jgi:FkbM family methyltransferase
MKRLDFQMADGTMRSFWRRDTEADCGVVRQVFSQMDYSLKPLRRGEELLALGRAMTRPLVIDAGANIGASVCWFARTFPESHIVAFEPDPENFALLQRNTEGLDVDLHQVAVGGHDGAVRLVDPGEGAWGYRTEPDANGEVPLVSIARVVAEKVEAGFTPLLAKIDIEGGEADLFAPPAEWVDAFPLLVVELHDWLMPGQGTSRTFLQCVAQRDRDFVHLGENVFSIRND